MQKLAAGIHQALGHGLGLDDVELRVRRIEAELGEKTGRVRLPGTKYVIAVGSGKGGVGKSTVAANLAVALAQLGLSVGLMDADIYGPSVPMMFGTGDERPRAVDNQHFYPVKKHGVSLISIGFFLGEKAPVIWRGPMVMGAVRQFLKDTLWGTQDFLIVDLPPGTGDAQLTLAQQVRDRWHRYRHHPAGCRTTRCATRGENVSPGALPDPRHRREHERVRMSRLRRAR